MIEYELTEGLPQADMGDPIGDIFKKPFTDAAVTNVMDAAQDERDEQQRIINERRDKLKSVSSSVLGKELHTEQEKYDLTREWVSAVAGQEPQNYQQFEHELDKLWQKSGNEGLAPDAPAVFDVIRKRLQEDEQKKDASNSYFDKGAKSVWSKSFSLDRSFAQQDVTPEERKLYIEAHNQGVRAQRARYGEKTIQQVNLFMDAILSTGAEDPDYGKVIPEMVEYTKNMTDDQKGLFVAAVREAVNANPSTETQTFFEQLGIGFAEGGQVFKRGWEWWSAEVYGNHAGVDRLRDGLFDGAENLFGVETKKPFDNQKQYEDYMHSVDMRRSLRNIFSGEYDPLEPLARENSFLSILEQSAYQAPQVAASLLMVGAPTLLASLVPATSPALMGLATAASTGAGFAMSAGEVQESQRQGFLRGGAGFDDASLKSRAAKNLVLTLPHYFIEKLKVATMARNVKLVDDLYIKLDSTLRARPLRFGAKATAQMTFQATEEQLQNYYTEFLNDVIGVFDDTMADVEWRNGKDGVFDGAWTDFAINFFTMSPVAIASASGGMSAENRAAAWAELPPLQRKAFGWQDMDIEAMDAARSPQEQVDAYNEARANMDASGEGAVEASKELNEVLLKKAEEFEQMQQKGQFPVSEVTFKGDKPLIKVFDPETDEVMLETDSYTEATARSLEWAGLKFEEDSANFMYLKTLLEASGRLAKENPETLNRLDVESQVNEQIMNARKPDAMRRAAEQADHFDKHHGGDGEIPKLFFGSNETGFNEAGQTRIINEVYKGGNIATLIHETGHGKFKEAVMRGMIDLDEVIRLLKNIDRGLDGKMSREAKFAGYVQPAESLRFLKEDKESYSFMEIDEAMAEFWETVILGEGRMGSMRELILENLKAQAQMQVTGKIQSFIAALRYFMNLALSRVAAMKKAVRDGEIDQKDIDKLRAMMQGTTVQEEITAAAEKDFEKTLKPAMEDDETSFSIGRADITPTANTQVFPTKDGGVVGEASFSISAFHGTPHKVDKFRAESIGTGEGAQAYGWGLYFAESAEVAENYRIRLAYDPDKQRINGRQINDEYSRYTRGTATEVDYQIAEGLERLMMHDSPAEVIEMFKEYGYSEKAIKYFEESDYETFGGLYQVELNVEQDELLDWDKPITKEQAAFIESLPKSSRVGLDDVINYEPYTTLIGSEFYWFLKKTAGDGGLWLDQESQDMAEVVSRGLSEMGIKGIKYLDGDSRGAGYEVAQRIKGEDYVPAKDRQKFSNRQDAEAYAQSKQGEGFDTEVIERGSYNYVIFNDADITIKTENGQEVDTTSFSISPAQDAAYMEAVESGDMETPQRMVDEAAKAAGYEGTGRENDPYWYRADRPERKHLDDSGLIKEEVKREDLTYPDTMDKPAIYLTPNPATAWYFASSLGEKNRPRQFFAKFKKTARAADRNAAIKKHIPITNERYFDRYQSVSYLQAHEVDALKKEGFDSAYGSTDVVGGDELVVFNPNQIKSADPVTYDSDGNVIPLSQRFDAGRDEISFAMGAEARRGIVPEGMGEKPLVKHIYLKEDGKFIDKIEDGDIVVDQDISEFEGMNIVLHQPDTAMAGEVIVDGETIVVGKGGVYYPVMFSEQGYFWASTKNAASLLAKVLNEVSANNGGKILMGLTSAPIDKLFSSTTMSDGTLNFFRKLSDSPSKYGITKAELNRAIVNASKVKNVNAAGKVSTFDTKLLIKDGLENNLKSIKSQLKPDESIFALRKDFVVQLAREIAVVLKDKPEQSKAVALMLAGGNNKFAKAAIKRGKLSMASILQGLGDMFSEPLVKTFQQFETSGGRLYAVLEMDGEVEAVPAAEHESYPFAIKSKTGNKPKVHVLANSYKWQDVAVDRDTKQSIPKSKMKSYYPSSGLSSTKLELSKPAEGVESVKLSFSMGQDVRKGILPPLEERITKPALRAEMFGDAKRRVEKLVFDYEEMKSDKVLKEKISAASLKKQGAMRQALRRDELEKGGMKPSEARSQAIKETKEWIAQEKLDMATDDKTNRLQTLRDMIVTYESILMALPTNIRGKMGRIVTLVDMQSEKAIMGFFDKKLKRFERVVDSHIRKIYEKSVNTLFKRARAKKKAGEKDKGKTLPAGYYRVFEAAEEARDMDDIKVDAKIAAIEKEIEGLLQKDELTSEKESELNITKNMVQLFGNWNNLTNADKEAALKYGWRQFEYAYLEQKIKKAQEREEMERKAMDLMQSTGVPLEEIQDRIAKHKTALGRWWNRLRATKYALWDFEQVLSYVFPDSKQVVEKVVQEQEANAQYEDSMAQHEDGVNNFFASMVGDSFLSIKSLKLQDKMQSLPFKVSGGGVTETMTQMEMITARLMWRQEDGRRHMENWAKNDWEKNYNQEFMDAVDKMMVPEAKALERYLISQYEQEYDRLNKIHEKIYGVSMPRNLMYSPLSVDPLQSLDITRLADPIASRDSGAIDASQPFLLRRNKFAAAKPVFRDALNLFYAHKRQAEYWVAYAPFLKELRSLMGNRAVRDAIQAKGGEEALRMVNSWVNVLTNNGIKESVISDALDRTLKDMSNRAAQAALVGRMSVLMMQSVELGSSLAQVPLKDYVWRMGKLFSGQLDFTETLKSDFIQRRIRQAPPAVRMAMEGMASGKPNVAKAAAEKMGTLISGADAFFTTATYAITYDYLTTKGGLDSKSAHKQAARLTEQVSQPIRMARRSMVELRYSRTALGKIGWAFASPARQKLALVGYRWAKAGLVSAETARAMAVTWGFGGAFVSIIRAVYSDLRDDEDEEIFDEKYWNPTRMGLQALMSPLTGIPVLGEAAEKAAMLTARSLGADVGYIFESGSLLSSVEDFGKSSVKTVEAAIGVYEDEEEVEKLIKELDKFLITIAPFSDTAAAASSFSHVVRDLFMLGKNIID